MSSALRHRDPRVPTAESNDDLHAELTELAATQRRLRVELAEVIATRTRLVSEARAQDVATWRELALMFDMTEHGLIKANRSRSRPPE